MSEKLDDLFKCVAEAGIFRRGGNLGTPVKLRRYLERLFAGVEIAGKEVIDVGAGTGVFSAYLALIGAKSVVALEPEQAGSHKDMTLKFQALLRRLEIENVTLVTKTIQEFLPAERPRDIVLLHNCINHFDEHACAHLQSSAAAQAVYREIFASLNRLVRVGGCVVLSDVTRHNVFDRLGLRSPLCPTINWKIHQPPEVWAALAATAGFECERVRWATFGHFGDGPQRLLANRHAAYFLLGQFSLVLRKSREVGPG